MSIRLSADGYGWLEDKFFCFRTAMFRSRCYVRSFLQSEIVRFSIEISGVEFFLDGGGLPLLIFPAPFQILQTDF